MKWQDPPPPPANHISASKSMRAELRAHPKKWALIKSYASVSRAHAGSYNIRKNWGPTFEITTRGQDLYARYVGLIISDAPDVQAILAKCQE